MCVNSVFVALELKKDDKEAKTTSLQNYNLQRIMEAGGVSLVAYPSNWDTTFDFLDQVAHCGYEYVMEKLEERNKHHEL